MSCARPNTPRSNAKDLGELAEPLRSRMWTAMLDAPTFQRTGTSGLTLVSGYRDPGRQWDLRHERCRGRECDRSCKGYPVTAVPAQLIGGVYVGGSDHQHRTAADMGGLDLQWLIDNRERYGMALTVSSENWHYSANRNDVRTGRFHGNPTVRIVPFPTGHGPIAHPTAALLAEINKPNPKPIPAPIIEEDAVRAYRFADQKVWACSAVSRRHIASRSDLNELIVMGLIAPVPESDKTREDPWVRKASKSGQTVLEKLPVVKG